MNFNSKVMHLTEDFVKLTEENGSHIVSTIYVQVY